MSQILKHYQLDVDKGKIIADDLQKEVIEQLQSIATNLKNSSLPEPSFFQRILNKPIEVTPVKGLYMWGGVGRGKTYLMDLFFDNIEFEKKHRVHFHRFMQSIHDELKLLKNESEPLAIVAKKFSDQYQLLCLDEFSVSDITDAMILARLLKHLFAQGITLITTSNIIPDDLYKDGLQRESFIPAIELLNKHTLVFNLDAGVDYRLRTLTKAKTWWADEPEKAKDHFESVFADLTMAEICERPLTLFQREIAVLKRGQGVAWFTFDQLCDGPRSVADYIAMSKLFHTIIITKVPQMSTLENDMARRFIEFIDECYDRRVNILVSATVSPDDLYQGKKLTAMFERTKSRLQEMQSQEYLGTPHLN